MPIDVRFNRHHADDKAFHAEVKRRVDGWFTESGVSKNANPLMWFKSVFWIGGSLACWAVVVTGVLPFPVSLVASAVLGFFIAAIGFNVGHDAIHGSYSANQRVNNALSWSYDLIGANARNWAHGHNVVHHTWTNVPGVDGDIEAGPALRFHPHEPHRWYHRYQHFYAWLMYMGFTLRWVFLGDFVLIQKPHPNTGALEPLSGYVKLVIGKVAHFGLLLVIPMIVLPWWQGLLGFIVMHMVGGLTLAVVFQLAHLVEGPEFPTPDADGNLERRWAVHQLLTTANFSGGNPVVSWIVGGLDYQIEHHLFPAICHIHYPKISPIVEQTAREFGLPYHRHDTVAKAVSSHFRLLRQLSQPSPR